MPKHLTAAVAYVRKSTKGKKAGGREKQEKSIPDQRGDILKLAKVEHCEIKRWYGDPGVSGWKREAKRPEFTQMLKDVRDLKDVKVVIVDDLDRFTRASWRKATADVDALAEAGVERIISVNDGVFNIADETDAGEAHRMVAIAMSNHELSRKISRRVTRARRNAAEVSKRTGGKAPYGYKLDGKQVEGHWVSNGRLKVGDKGEVKIIRWLFEQFGRKAKSLNSLAGELNAREVPAPRGGKWSATIVSQLLRNPVYKGCFRYNAKHVGQFYGIDAEGEIVEASKLNGERKLYLTENWCEPLVDAKLFDRVQSRLGKLSRDRSARKAGYALSGVLVCGHCGSPMYPSRQDGRVSYKCSKNLTQGTRSCGYWRVREDVIAPYILRMLGEDLKNVEQMLTNAPIDAIESRRRRRNGKATDRKQRLKELKDEIATGESTILKGKITDPRTLKSLDQQLTKMRDEAELIEAELSMETQESRSWSREELGEIRRFWDQFMEEAVSVPLTGKQHPVVGLMQDPFSDEQAVLLEPRVVNELLRDCGAEIKLWWELDDSGKQKRYRLKNGWYKLGKRSGKIPRGVLEPTTSRESSPARART